MVQNQWQFTNYFTLVFLQYSQGNGAL